MEWLREDIRQIRSDLREMRDEQSEQGERLATIEERLESVRRGKVEKAGIWGAVLTAISSLAVAAFK